MSLEPNTCHLSPACPDGHGPMEVRNLREGRGRQPVDVPAGAIWSYYCPVRSCRWRAYLDAHGLPLWPKTSVMAGSEPDYREARRRIKFLQAVRAAQAAERNTKLDYMLERFARARAETDAMDDSGALY